MSKTYQLQLGMEEGEDSSKSHLKMLPIVPQIDGILADELKQRGWDIKDKVASKKFGTVTATVDTVSGDVEMKSKARLAVVGRGYDARDNKERGEALAREDGEKKRGAVREEAKAKAAKAMLDVSETVRTETLDALRSTTIRALRIKAATMGHVESEVESVNARGEREFKIKIKV